MKFLFRHSINFIKNSSIIQKSNLKNNNLLQKKNQFDCKNNF